MASDTTLDRLATEYHRSVHAAEKAGVSAEPEAQITIPFANLLKGVARAVGLRPLEFIRETRVDNIRPDFSILMGTRFGGWAELKAPDITLDGDQWKGAQRRRQWEVLRQLDAVILCNGLAARLYVSGEQHGPDATLPWEMETGWDPSPLMDLLRRFCDVRPKRIRSVTDLAKRLAERARDLRDRLLWHLAQETPAGAAAREAFESWQLYVHPACTERDFGDGMAQVVAYGLVLASMTTDADTNGDGIVQAAEAREALRETTPFMAAAFGPLLENPDLFRAVRVEVTALETLVSAIDVDEVTKRADRGRGETWLYFYEDFLAVYDPEQRKQAGVYFTPTEVVAAMVRIVDHVLYERFGCRLGFADPSVVTLDPATGTGTFPLAVIDRAAFRAAERGPGGSRQAAQNLAKNLFAFELLPGPYAVAHLRIAQQLTALDDSHGHLPAQVVLTDSIESPEALLKLGPLFGDLKTLAQEQHRANRIKQEQRVTVVIGNPPYRRVDKESRGGRGSGAWILSGSAAGREGGKSLFDDLLDVAKKHTIFSHHASLYNLYVYFWRWAIWKAFEAHGPGPGVVALITGNSWLYGPGFVGLRKLAREICDEVWVLDLGGDNKGANPEENVFAIETPVAVVVLVRTKEFVPETPAHVRYRRIRGTKEEKLQVMRTIAESEDPLTGPWNDAPSGILAPFKPVTGGRDWARLPALADIFPLQQPGCKFNRLWPISPHPDVLRERWERFVAASPEDKPVLFQTAKSGRHIHTVVSGLQKLANLTTGSSHEQIVRYGYRSFDVQWTFDDPRLAALERPALWQSYSPKQVYFTSLMTGNLGSGPSMTASAFVPDMHYFNGRGGKDVLPLYRDAAAQQPNVTKGLLETLAEQLDIHLPEPEDLAAYVYVVMSSPQYTERFAEGLRTPGPRVPITKDPELWNEAVALGRRLLWLHTYGERFRDDSVGRGKYIPCVEGLGWTDPVEQMPERLNHVHYLPDDGRLVVGNGSIIGVPPAVWEFSVSGMPILRKWLGYRTVRGAGKATSSKNPLNRIRLKTWPDEWNDDLLDLLRVLMLTVEHQATQADLLDRICDGTLLVAKDCPRPSDEERHPPSTIKRFSGGRLL